MSNQANLAYVDKTEQILVLNDFWRDVSVNVIAGITGGLIVALVLLVIPFVWKNWKRRTLFKIIFPTKDSQNHLVLIKGPDQIIDFKVKIGSTIKVQRFELSITIGETRKKIPSDIARITRLFDRKFSEEFIRPKTADTFQVIQPNMPTLIKKPIWEIVGREVEGGFEGFYKPPLQFQKGDCLELGFDLRTLQCFEGIFSFIGFDQDGTTVISSIPIVVKESLLD